MTIRQYRTPKLYQLILAFGIFSVFHSSYSMWEIYSLNAKDPSNPIPLATDIKLELLIGYILSTLSLLLIYTNNLKPINYTEKFKNLGIDSVEDFGFEFNSFVNRRSELKI